ncbi:thioester domain-containing protein [Kouleothrix sp.]|uniref:thioester domain-containing protein n=1 Tax=Kouleothrix sp. TaxID=2779161 RepID=UPI00391AD081
MNRITRATGHGWRNLLALLAVLALLAPVAALAQPLSGTFIGKVQGRQVAFSHNGKPRNDWAGVLKFRLDDGSDVPVFCIQLDVRVSAGDRYTSGGSVAELPNGCQIRYLLDTYPASSATTADEAAARQLAIWAFSDNLDLATVADAAVRDRAIALANEARGKPCPPHRTEAPDLAIEPAATSAAPGQVVAYSVRAGPADAGQPLTVAVDGPAALTDASGASGGQQQQQITLDAQGAASFWVVGTGAGQSSVRAALSYELDAGTVYSEHDPSHPTQRLVQAESASLTASAAAQIQWAAGAPGPSPSPTASPAPPTPTRRPRPPAPTDTPEATPTGELASATPAAPAETPAATPAAPAETPAAPASGTLATPAPTLPLGPAGGAPPNQPRSLPRTGAPADRPAWLLLVGSAMVLGGWLASRRARS